MPREKDTPTTRRGYDKLDMAMTDLRLNYFLMFACDVDRSEAIPLSLFCMAAPC